MALEQSFTTAHGITVSTAYWKIYKIELNIKKAISSCAYVLIYKDLLSSRNNLVPLDILKFDFNMNLENKGENPISQAYTSLKTQTLIKDDKGKTITIDLSKAKDV